MTMSLTLHPKTEASTAVHASDLSLGSSQDPPNHQNYLSRGRQTVEGLHYL